MKFEVTGQRHKFGSKLFPVASKSKMQLFNAENTIELDREDPKIIEFAKQLDKFNYPMGHCYSNTNIIVQIARGVGLDTEYYAGWTMFPDLLPLHHAWVVINSQSVIDVGFNSEEFIAMQECNKNELGWKEKLAYELAKIRKQEYPTSKYCVFGKLNPWNILVGSPDEMENAKRIFRALTKSYPNHPSYIHRHGSMTGASNLQKMIHKQI